MFDSSSFFFSYVSMISLSWLSIVDSMVKKVSSSLGVKLSKVLLSYFMAECFSFFVFLI